jgi:hypothetical protein
VQFGFAIVLHSCLFCVLRVKMTLDTDLETGSSDMPGSSSASTSGSESLKSSVAGPGKAPPRQLEIRHADAAREQVKSKLDIYTIPKGTISDSRETLFETAASSNSTMADAQNTCSAAQAKAILNQMSSIMESISKISPQLNSQISSPSHQQFQTPSNISNLNANLQNTLPTHTHNKFCPSNCPFDQTLANSFSQNIDVQDESVGVNDFLSEADLIRGSSQAVDFDFNPQYDFQSRVAMSRQFCPPYNGPIFEGIDCDKSPALFLREYVNYTSGQGVHPSLVFKKDMSAALKEDALNWWHYSGQFQTWDQFCSLFMLIFNSPHKDAIIEEEIRERFQYDGETLYRFMNALETMFLSLSYITPENVKLKRILFNMHPCYKRQLQGCRFTTVNELAQYTVLAERKLQCEMQWKKPQSNKNWSNPKFGFYDDGYATQQTQPHRQVSQTQNFVNYQQPMAMENAKYADPETICGRHPVAPAINLHPSALEQMTVVINVVILATLAVHVLRGRLHRHIIGAHLPRTNMGLGALRKIQFIFLLVRLIQSTDVLLLLLQLSLPMHTTTFSS